MSQSGPQENLPIARPVWRISGAHRTSEAFGRQGVSVENDPDHTSAPCWISTGRTQQLFDVCRTPQVRQ
jgi:hypothetical protein